MNPADFDFELPEALIAQAPLPERSRSRLLHLPSSGPVEDLRFVDLSRLVRPGDLLILNDTRVLPARLFGSKASGGHIEILLERALDERLALVQLRASKSPGVGTVLHLQGGESATVEGRDGDFFLLRFATPVVEVFERHGHMPLPPYIKRADDPADRERYQTVFARVPGAVAAPTAGLHFDAGQLHRLRSRGVGVAYITLHVGAGTYQPLREAQLSRGELHPERLHVPAATCQAIDEARALGGRVVAVGTTVVRALETVAVDGQLAPCERETRLFIRPGFRFRVVDALLTNFHLPGSSLLMLVGAFAGVDRVMAAYRHAVAQRYRFFSYGDAMFCHRADAV